MATVSYPDAPRIPSPSLAAMSDTARQWLRALLCSR